MKKNENVPDLYGTIVIQGNYYGVLEYDKESEAWNFNPCGRWVKVVEVQEVLETKEEYLKLRFLSNITTKEEKEVLLPRDSFERKSSSELLKIGIDAQPHNNATLFKLLHKQELMLPKSIVHIGLGWQKIALPDNTFKLVYKDYRSVGDIKSEYAGKLEIRPKGSYDTYIKMVQKEVLGYIPLEFSFVLGLTPVVLGYYNMFTPVDSIVVHKWGDSTTGKTSSAKLATSTSSRPSFVGDTLMSTFKATKNAITRQLVGNHGTLQVFDEISMFEGKDLTDTLYTLASGTEKKRLSKDSTMKPTETWSTLILTTGEKNITNDSKKNTGITVRAISFGNIAWTKSAAHAETILACINENYGFCNKKLAKYLLTQTPEKIFSVVEYWRKRYVKSTKVRDEFTDRISLKYALILATAELVKEALSVEIHPYKILDFLIKNECDNYETKDIGVKAYEYLLQAVQINADSFGIKNGNDIIDAKSPRKWGLIENLKSVEKLDGKECEKYIVITETILIDILKEAGFEDVNIVLKNWKNKNILNYEKGRNFRHRKIIRDGTPIKVYIIRIFSDEPVL